MPQIQGTLSWQVSGTIPNQSFTTEVHGTKFLIRKNGKTIYALFVGVDDNCQMTGSLVKCKSKAEEIATQLNKEQEGRGSSTTPKEQEPIRKKSLVEKLNESESMTELEEPGQLVTPIRQQSTTTIQQPIISQSTNTQQEPIKAQSKPTRYAQVLYSPAGKDSFYWLLRITAKEVSDYLLEWIRSDSYRITKLESGCNTSYTIYLSRRESNCTCKAHTNYGQCKHVQALISLIKEDKV